MPPEVLSELRELRLPEAPGWWPPAPGWWLVAILSIALAVWSLLIFRRARARRQVLREALAELNDLNQALASGALPPMLYLDQVNALLKRLLIHGYGEHHVSGLSSDGWARAVGQFLHRFSKPNTLMRIETSLLGEFRYMPCSNVRSDSNLRDLRAACERLGVGLERALEELNPPEVRA